MAEDTADAAETAKNTNTGGVSSSGAGPVFGSQPLSSAKRRGPGIGEREVELEQLAVLRRKNAEARLKRERDAALQREKDMQLAAEYAERKKAQQQSRQEERSACPSASVSRSHPSTSSRVFSPRRRLPLDEELAQDEEFRELFERYGDRLRVPMPPPPPTTSRSQSPRKPAVPSQPKKLHSVPNATTEISELIAASTTAPHSARRASAVGHEVAIASGGHVGGRASASAGHGHPVGRLSGSGAALPPINMSPRNAQNVEEPSAEQTCTQDEIPEPERSVMPRKELLRKKQQAILRKTEVTFYKRQMDAQFQKILAAVEMTYNDPRRNASLNLAKPRLQQESKR